MAMFPPRRLPAARRRRQLLDVALDLFGARGYHATSMDDIAERAGVTKPVLYQHFPSKSTLYHELIVTMGDELLEVVAAGAMEESSPHRRVLGGFRAYFRFVEEQTSAFLLLFGNTGSQTEESIKAVRRVERSIAATIAELIEVDLPRDHLELLGYGIVGLAEVTSRQWVLRAEEAFLAGEAAATDGSEPTPPAHIVLDRGEGEVLAERLSDLVWAGLRGLPPSRPPG